MRPVPFHRFVEEVLALNEPPIRAKGTYRQARQVLREFAELPGLKTCADIRPTIIAAWIKAHSTRTPVRTASLLRAFSAACSYGVSAGYLRQTPFTYRRVNQWVREQVVAPDHPQPPRHQSVEAVDRLLRLVDDEASQSWKARRLQALVYVLAFTGIRKGEALHLRPWDFDLEKRIVSIQPRRSNRLKTRASAARLPLADPLIDVLRLWLPHCGGQWVFPGVRLMTPWTNGSPGYKPLDEIRDAGERAGIKGWTIAGFRKTLGTFAKQWGLGQLELKALLRHSNVETQRYYDEEQVETLRPAVAKIRYRLVSPS
jgi:integrase